MPARAAALSSGDEVILASRTRSSPVVHRVRLLHLVVAGFRCALPVLDCPDLERLGDVHPVLAEVLRKY